MHVQPFAVVVKAMEVIVCYVDEQILKQTSPIMPVVPQLESSATHVLKKHTPTVTVAVGTVKERVPVPISQQVCVH